MVRNNIIKIVGISIFTVGCATKSKIEKDYLKDPDKYTPQFVKFDVSDNQFFRKSINESGNIYTFNIKNNGASYDSVYLKVAAEDKIKIISLKNYLSHKSEDGLTYYSTFSLKESVLIKLGMEIGSDLTSQWNLSVKGIAENGRLKSSWSETISGVKFRQVEITMYDTLNKHLLSYGNLYLPKIIQSNEEPIRFETDEDGRAFYPLKISVNKKMPKYEVLIGVNNKGLNPIRLLCDDVEDFIDINYVKGAEEFKLVLSAIEAHKQCNNNGFIKVFNLKDALGNSANAEEAFYGAIWPMKVRGYFNDTVRGPWSELIKVKFKCQ